MRVTSAFFVDALIRRANRAGSPAVLVRRGAAEAGAIFIIERFGALALFGPAPQVSAGSDGGRCFEVLLAGVEDQDVEARIASELRFDPDIFVVEIEGKVDELIDLA